MMFILDIPGMIVTQVITSLSNNKQYLKCFKGVTIRPIKRSSHRPMCKETLTLKVVQKGIFSMVKIHQYVAVPTPVRQGTPYG